MRERSDSKRGMRHGLFTAALLAFGTPALAQPPAIPPGQAKRFVQDVAQARIVDLSFTWDESSPIAGVNPPYSMQLNATHSATRGMFGDNGQLSFASEVQGWSGQHGAPSLDALGHIGHNGQLYGGVDAAAATSDPRGIGRSGVGAHLAIDAFPVELMTNRGVLLDVARFIQGNGDPLPATFEITAQHLADTAAAQGITVQPGDTVFIRTGWGQYFDSNPQKYMGDDSPGLGMNGAQWLIDQGAAVVGNDTLTFEQRPPLVFAPQFQVFPVHMLLIADNGVYIMENVNLEEISASGVHEFVAVTPPLKIRGGTGSALRAFAVVPPPAPGR